jgi:sodium/hydrogen antiporter
MTVDTYEGLLALIGLAALAAAWLPSYTERRPISLPVVLMGLGALFFLLPVDLFVPDPRRHVQVAERLTEMAVIVALMGAGLKIDRPFSWRTWGSTWRLLAIAMPLTIALVAVCGAVVGGLGVSTAVLLGAALAPTDPVLASDVQVGEPTLDEEASPRAEDEVRFALTSEAGLNDALAFPFVYLAIRMAEEGPEPGAWLLRWVAWDLVGRIAIGLLVGWLIGRVLVIVSFQPPGPLSALSDTPQGFVAVSATLLAYGTTELLHGYGFLAVFVAAVVLRSAEPQHDFHGSLHSFIEQAENLIVVGLLLLFGGSLVYGVLGGLTWRAALVAVLLVFVIRPASGLLAMAGTRLSTNQRWVVSFFGIRGFGSIYYLAYGLSAAPFGHTEEAWGVISLAVALSIATHGITATPAMRGVDRSGGVTDQEDP